jgi:hypothetical protein
MAKLVDLLTLSSGISSFFITAHHKTEKTLLSQDISSVHLTFVKSRATTANLRAEFESV